MTFPADTQHDVHTRITKLRCQFGAALIGVPLEPVRLRWAVESATAGERQIGYQVRVRSGQSAAWTEFAPVSGSDAIDIEPGDGPLRPRETRIYEVRIQSTSGWTSWSDAVVVEGGVDGADLAGVVIDIPSEVEGPTPILRREFNLDDVTSARLRISALGNYEVFVNGVRATDGILNPGWTSYQDRILVDTLDIARLLHPGRNAVAITVADGWYRGRFGFADRTRIYGDRIGAIAQLEVTGVSGHTVIATDTTWRGGFGAVRSASIYDGTVIDMTQDVGDPSLAGFDDSSWTPASVVPTDAARFVPRGTPPVTEIAALAMIRGSRGTAVTLDAGQNLAGWVRLVVEGRRGDTVTVRHAEVLEPDGSLHTAALRSAKATDRYVLGTDGRVELEPLFTFHGFRYAEVTGDASVVAATAVAISSAVTPRSTFSSSHATLDRFHENVRWSQRDNFVSLPTDCPQRDERLGWTGDAQAFAPTASTLFDSESFWTSWLRDLEADQTDEGGVASVVPNIIGPDDMRMGGEPTNAMGRAGWADAATIVPLAVYDAYGSKSVLRTQLSSMRRWVAHLERRAGVEVLLPEEPFQYGDWLDPDAPGDRPWAAKVDSLFVANAFYARSARLLARAERALGLEAAAAEHDELADHVGASVWERWGAVAGDTQTGASMCLVFEIVPAAERAELAARLAADVRREEGRIATGFLGTPLVLDALSSTGHLNEAYRMLLRRDAPSWLYQVDRGATTVWERWDAIRPDGTIHAGEMDTKEGDSMISFNHYAYGAVIDWVYRNVGGLAPASPGYRTARIAPRPATSLRRASASIDTAYGTLSIAWELDDAATFTATVQVPFGIEAQLDLPVTDASTVTTDGGPAVASLTHGTHTVVVTSAAIAPVDAPAH